MKYFPDCKLSFFAQKIDGQPNPEWMEARRGILTASEFAEWLVEEPKVRTTIPEMKKLLDDAGVEYKKSAKHGELVALFSPEQQHQMATMTAGGMAARKKAACKLLAQAAGCWEPPFFENDVIRRGTELEPEAVECFEQDTGLKVTPVGFARSDHGKFGCSPDGIIEASGEGFEGKCPLPEVHCAYVLDGRLPDEYRHQVHGSMAVTGAESWWFQSYCPGLPPLRVKVYRDSFTESIFAGLLRFGDLLEKTRRELKDHWESWQRMRVALEIANQEDSK